MLKPANFCRSCGKDFASIQAFDRHRVGKHEYTYSEGVKMEPMREDGRRCLRDDEFEEANLVLDRRGRWAIRKTKQQMDFYRDRKVA